MTENSESHDPTNMKTAGLPADETVVVSSHLSPGTPERIADFTLKQVIASGGMGTVYLAVQDQPRRNVALKLMKKGIVSESTLRRFEFESQVLGRLRHPNIAQVYKAGMHDDAGEAVPFFAMEYIPKAKPLADYVRHKRLGTHDTLRLFVKVCHAVYHGHQKGVIHRDLKPDNILVDAEGEPKIIDFGVARTTGSDIAVTTLQTDVGQLIGTLQYMSPEQCETDSPDIDTRSDVYALGVVLYEVLTQRLPYDLTNVAIFEAARVVCEQAPPRPSTLNRALRGDIETIVMKAIEKDRDRRYQSASDLARDIERYLNDEPINARPPTVTYQMRMFARRNRGVVAAGLIIAIVMVASTIVSIVFGVQAKVAEHRALNAEQAAIAERDLADAARDEVELAKKESDRQRDAAVLAEAHAQRQTYLVNVATAANAISDHDTRGAQRRLAKAPERFRGWEWDYLRNLADSSHTVITGNTAWINSVAFSSDGSKIVSGSTDGAVRVLSATTGEPVIQLAGHSSPVYAVACSPDGLHAASASADMTVKIWDLRTGAELATLRGHEGVVTSICYSRDGSKLVSASSDQTIRLWAMATAETESLIALEDASVDCVALSPDGLRVAAGSDDHMIRLFDVQTGRSLAVMKGHEGYVNAIAYSQDGSYIASASEDATIRVWDAVDGTEAHVLTGHSGYVTSVAYSPDGSHLVSGSEDGSVKVWEPDSGREVVSLRGHLGFVTAVAFDPLGNNIATASEDQTIRLWDPHSFEVVGGERLGGGEVPATSIRDVAFNPEGTTIATAGEDHSIGLWEATSGLSIGQLFGHTGGVRAVVFSPDGRWLASGSDDNTVRLWDARTGEGVHILTGHQRLISDIAFAPDSRTVLTGSWDGSVIIWDVERAEPLATLDHVASVQAMAITSTGSELAVGLSNGEIVIWSLPDRQRLASLTKHNQPVSCLAFSPDGKLLASGSTDASICLWSGDRFGDVIESTGHELEVTSLAFADGGLRLLSGSADHTVGVWDTEAAELIASLPNAVAPITCLAMGPDGLRCATGSSTGELRIRDSAAPALRAVQRNAYRFALGPARAKFERMLKQEVPPREIIARVMADESINPIERKCLLNCALAHCCRVSE